MSNVKDRSPSPSGAHQMHRPHNYAESAYFVRQRYEDTALVIFQQQAKKKREAKAEQYTPLSLPAPQLSPKQQSGKTSGGLVTSGANYTTGGSVGSGSPRLPSPHERSSGPDSATGPPLVNSFGRPSSPASRNVSSSQRAAGLLLPGDVSPASGAETAVSFSTAPESPHAASPVARNDLGPRSAGLGGGSPADSFHHNTSVPPDAVWKLNEETPAEKRGAYRGVPASSPLNDGGVKKNGADVLAADFRRGALGREGEAVQANRGPSDGPAKSAASLRAVGRVASGDRSSAGDGVSATGSGVEFGRYGSSGVVTRRKVAMTKLDSGRTESRICTVM